MTRDPVAAQFSWHRQLRIAIKHQTTRVIRWKRWIQLFSMIAIASFALALNANDNAAKATSEVAHEAKHRVEQLQDVICGVYVPISQIGLTPKSPPPLKTIVLATRHGAVDIRCPGAN